MPLDAPVPAGASVRKFLSALTVVLAVVLAGCRSGRLENRMDAGPAEIEELRAAYDAFNRGDLDAAVRSLDDHILWIEPAEFPGGGTYHGKEEVKRYLSQSRAGAANVISIPERFIVSGDRIVVFVHARVQLQAEQPWQEVRLADVYIFRNGKAVQMRAFSDREEALHWTSANQ